MPLVVSVLFSNCGVRQSDFDKLKSENDSLVQVLEQKNPDSFHQHSSVPIKNSSVTELTSKFTHQSYDLYISFPNHYENSGKQYPVLVVLDAEVNFGAVSYIVQRLIKDEIIPEILVVGIAYQGETEEEDYYSIRGRDLTPTADESYGREHKLNAGTGGAEDFIKFLSFEFFPYLANNYPIKSEGKSLYGHSFGGLFGVHTMLNHSNIFDNYILLSPSLWWNHSQILKDAKQNALVNSKRAKIYMGTGEMEGGMVKDHLEMAELLKHSNTTNLAIQSEILDHETHRTIFGRGFTNGLRFIYAKE